MLLLFAVVDDDDRACFYVTVMKDATVLGNTTNLVSCSMDSLVLLTASLCDGGRTDKMGGFERGQS